MKILATLAIIALSAEAINIRQNEDAPMWGKGGRPENDEGWMGGEGQENNQDWRDDISGWKDSRPSRADSADADAWRAAQQAWIDSRPTRGD